ncbi:MAG: molybdopterin-dependent oxidoreductase [Syntrophorhabdaceae bacterium]|nr:molybdopterin-dependent oxidoreductase [Syntrophorhabdaceae bacterium]
MNDVKKVITDCTLCYHSCGTIVTVENGRAIKVEGLPSHPLNKGKLCEKGEAMLDNIYDPNRLKYPMKRTEKGWERVSWDQALDEIASKLLSLKERYGPSVLGVFSGSIGVENLEMAGLTQRFKAAFGSPNFFSVESICYRMRIRTRQLTFGKYPTEELDSNLYILWGHNPEQSDFPLKLAIEENLKKGAKIVVIDPKRIPIADKAVMYLRIRPGTDGALALAMIHVIIKEGLYDRDFIENYTVGFDKLVTHIEPYTPEWAEKITWVCADDIRKLARLFATTKGASIYQGTCTQDQTANGTQNSRAFSILQIITGNINNPGGWVISPRLPLGNVGMGVEGEPLGADKYPLFYEIWGRKSPYGVVTCVPESVPEKLKAFFVIGGNPILSMADSNAFKEAFRKLELLVVHDMFMTETGEYAHYVLPACSHLEKWGVAYTYNVCHCLPYLMLRKKAIEPLYESWSEWKFFTELAKRLGIGDKFPWKTEEELVAYELEPTGLTFDELLHVKPEGAFYQEKKYGMEGVRFATPSRKIEIFSQALLDIGFDPLPTYLEPHRSPLSTPELLEKYPLILSTGSRNLYYTHGQFRNVKSLKEKNPEPKAEIGPETAEKYGIKDGDEIIIETNRGQVKMKASVDGRMAEGVVIVPHGWPGDANANLLTDTECREPIMGYPEIKSLLCAIRKA